MSGAGTETATELAGVLFDMDGTLLESEQLWAAALDALAAQLGGVLSQQARLAMVGTHDTETMSIFYSDLGITAPDRAADRRFIGERMAELYLTDLTWRPGAAELVAQVRAAGVPTALVTSTGRPLVEMALDRLLGRDTFDTVVCADDVTDAKPHPEPYRTAAARLGFPPAACVAIEDSPAGLRSARDAGTVALGVPGEVPLTGIDGVHLVASLTDVDLSFLLQLVAGGAVTRSPR